MNLFEIIIMDINFYSCLLLEINHFRLLTIHIPSIPAGWKMQPQ